MKAATPVEITVGTLRAMTPEQFIALRDNVLAQDRWETADKVMISGSDPLGVQPLKYKRASAHTTSAYESMLFIGIEKDGYTHS